MFQRFSWLDLETTLFRLILMPVARLPLLPLCAFPITTLVS